MIVFNRQPHVLLIEKIVFLNLQFMNKMCSIVGALRDIKLMAGIS